ncbi:MBL fold metallo-hydrolase [Candidatus Bathyarchaeota archaeon]|nr:MBL fold metallo-hydrolase [Candidatus Bathyarchaeota archaeon]
MESVNNLRLKKGEVGIFWFGQNTYVLKTSNETTIAIDPYLSRDKRLHHVHPEPPIKPEEFNVDYVFCTHDHWDHTDPIALPIIAKKFPETVILGSHETCQHLTELGVEKKNLVPLKPKTAFKLQGFSVTPYYSVSPEEADTTHYGYVFEIEGIKIYNMGDTFQSVVKNPESILGEIANVSPDIAMFPIIGDTPQRKPEDAFKFTMVVKPKIVIPCHYDCFSDRTIDPQNFIKLFKEVTSIKPIVIPYKGKYVYSVS